MNFAEIQSSLKKIGDLFVTRSVFEAWLEASRDDNDTFPIGAASLLIWSPLYHDLSVDVSPLLEDIQDMPRGNMKSEVILFEIPDPNDFFNRLL